MRVALFPFASELERPLPNDLADRLVGGDGAEPFGLRFVVGSQVVRQTLGLTLRSQLRLLDPALYFISFRENLGV